MESSLETCAVRAKKKMRRTTRRAKTLLDTYHVNVDHFFLILLLGLAASASWQTAKEKRRRRRAQ